MCRASRSWCAKRFSNTVGETKPRARGRPTHELAARIETNARPCAARAQFVKVGDDNVASQRLFESLGFSVHKHLAVFEQTELRLPAAMAREACAQHWMASGARQSRLRGVGIHHF